MICKNIVASETAEIKLGTTINVEFDTLHLMHNKLIQAGYKAGAKVDTSSTLYKDWELGVVATGTFTKKHN